MATPSFLLLFLPLNLLLLLLLPVNVSAYWYPPMKLTIVNNCPFTVWPAIQPKKGYAVLERGGFALPTLSYRSFPAPNRPWSGSIWARTFCSSCSRTCFSCATGDCRGRIECRGLSGSPPFTLAQLTLHRGGRLDLSSYSVSLVHGFNVPMTVTPHGGRGECPVVGCREDLLESCPARLKVSVWGRVVGCKSGCDVYRSDRLCCTGPYGLRGRCRESRFSRFFKAQCPATYTYAQDRPSVQQRCAAPMELKVIFCP